MQKISGQPLDVFLKERIFEPLSMTDTGFYVPAEKEARFAANYYSDGKGRMIIRDDPSKSGYLLKPGLSSGGGGLVGTASDYMRFLLDDRERRRVERQADSFARVRPADADQPVARRRRLDRLRRRRADGRRLRSWLSR